MGKHSHSDLSKLSLTGVIVTLGIIYGDIGTSPLYVLKAILFSAPVINEMLILGALSCIIWTLTLQTTIKYVIITLRADNKGEGGIFSLFTLLRKRRRWLTTFAIIGGSTLLADGIITPSITVTSAVEGLKLFNPDIPVIPIVIIIITGLFFVQQFGTSFVGTAFGPSTTPSSRALHEVPAVRIKATVAPVTASPASAPRQRAARGTLRSCRVGRAITVAAAAVVVTRAKILTHSSVKSRCMTSRGSNTSAPARVRRQRREQAMRSAESNHQAPAPARRKMPVLIFVSTKAAPAAPIHAARVFDENRSLRPSQATSPTIAQIGPPGCEGSLIIGQRCRKTPLSTAAVATALRVRRATMAAPVPAATSQ